MCQYFYSRYLLFVNLTRADKPNMYDCYFSRSVSDSPARSSSNRWRCQRWAPEMRSLLEEAVGVYWKT